MRLWAHGLDECVYEDTISRLCVPSTCFFVVEKIGSEARRRGCVLLPVMRSQADKAFLVRL